MAAIMARKGFNPNQPRDAGGRFASGGGSGGGRSRSASGGTRKTKPAGSSDGRRGPRGGKVGTRAQQAKAKREQAARTAHFQSKAAPSAAKKAWKKAQGEARKAAKSGGGKVVLDEARWRRIAQRVKTRGEVRAYIEGKRQGGYNSSTEKRVFAAYATRQRAEQFLLGLTRNKADKSFRGSRVSGLTELNANFQSRKRGRTGSTSIGVAARNRIYDEERRAKRAANKEARVAGQAKPSKPRRRR